MVIMMMMMTVVVMMMTTTIYLHVYSRAIMYKYMKFTDVNNDKHICIKHGHRLHVSHESFSIMISQIVLAFNKYKR